ncbi:MAG: hypothetical protein AB2776_19005 [Candidatus Thiodiazotropha endolucinida]
MKSSENRLNRLLHTFEHYQNSAAPDTTHDEVSYFMGISLMSTRFFSKNVIWNYLQHFDADNRHFVILVADSLESHNYQHFYSLPIDEARHKSKSIGMNYLRGYEKVGRNFNKCRIVLTSDLEMDHRYALTRKKVVEFYSTSREFRNNVKFEVKKNLGAFIDGLPQMNPEHHPSDLERYVLGEIAITLYLHQISGAIELQQVSRNKQSILTELTQYEDLLLATKTYLTSGSYIHWTPEGNQRAAA